MSKDDSKYKKTEIIKCKCGCNSEINKFDSRNRIRYFITGHNTKNRKHSNITKQKISSAHLGIKFSSEHKQHLKENHKGMTGLHHSFKTKLKLREQRIGEKCWNWKGGSKSILDRLRKSFLYKQWRESVLKRDDYKCINCFNPNKLEAHHIKQFAYYPESRFDINNGVTLCWFCHKWTENYGKQI